MTARPILSLTGACERSGLSYPTASSGMKLLEELGIAHEITGWSRGWIFAYSEYISVLNEGTEPL